MPSETLETGCLRFHPSILIYCCQKFEMLPFCQNILNVIWKSVLIIRSDWSRAYQDLRRIRILPVTQLTALKNRLLNMTVARNEIMNSICETKSGHVSEMWCIMRLFNNAHAYGMTSVNMPGQSVWKRPHLPNANGGCILEIKVSLTVLLQLLQTFLVHENPTRSTDCDKYS